MVRILERRLAKGVMSAGLALAVLAGAAQAQVFSPLTSAQRGPMTAAQLEQVAATAIPMENLLTDSPFTGGAASPAALGGAASVPIGQSVVRVAAPVISQGNAGPVESGMTRSMSFSTLEDLTGTAPQGSGAVAPQNYGNGNLNTIYHYNDYLQFPFPATYAPYRQAGQLLFQAADGGWYTCTAALIQRTILITAGHCVHDGENGVNGWNRDGYFYPAYAQNYPRTNQYYGWCQTVRYATTDGWFNNGSIQQGYDVAMAICGRLWQGSNTAVRGQFPGVALGWFGFCYENCTMGYNFLTQIGYPANYYDGGQMTISQHIEETALSGGPDYLYGTGMRGGSSGGPHIQNIGEIRDSAFAGYNTARNIIYAVTSWGYVSDIYKVQGASPISGPGNTNNAQAMFNGLCQNSRNWFGAWTCQFL
jgi:V8-like Glu-specific endopeptidase